MALPVIQLLSTFSRGQKQKVDSNLPEPLPGRYRADSGRTGLPPFTGAARIPAAVRPV